MPRPSGPRVRASTTFVASEKPKAANLVARVRVAELTMPEPEPPWTVFKPYWKRLPALVAPTVPG